MNSVKQCHSRRLEKTLEFLNANAFARAEDRLCEYSKNSSFYYIAAADYETYYIINHYNQTSRMEFQGFDLWLSQYNSFGHIGRKAAKSITSIKHSIHLPNDAGLMK